jgi:hypothetical protein
LVKWYFLSCLVCGRRERLAQLGRLLKIISCLSFVKFLLYFASWSWVFHFLLSLTLNLLLLSVLGNFCLRFLVSFVGSFIWDLIYHVAHLILSMYLRILKSTEVQTSSGLKLDIWFRILDQKPVHQFINFHILNSSKDLSNRFFPNV